MSVQLDRILENGWELINLPATIWRPESDMDCSRATAKIFTSYECKDGNPVWRVEDVSTGRRAAVAFRFLRSF